MAYGRTPPNLAESASPARDDFRVTVQISRVTKINTQSARDITELQNFTIRETTLAEAVSKARKFLEIISPTETEDIEVATDSEAAADLGRLDRERGHIRRG